MVLDLDHTERSLITGNRIHLAGLEDVHIRITFLPEAVIFIVIDALERIAHEPAVAFVLGRTVRKGDEFVPVGVHVQAGFPAPVASFDEGAVDRKLDTPVPRGADVGGGAGHAGRSGQAQAEQDVLGVDAIVLDRTAETALEEGIVQTEVPGVGVLPAEFGVGKRRDIVAGGVFFLVEVVHLGGQGTQRGIRRHGLVGSHAVADAELQLVEPAAGTRHEGLVVDVPTDGNGRVGVPLVAGSQTGGGVGTDGRGDHVAVIKGVHQTGHIGNQAVLRVAARVDRDVGGQGGADVVPLEELVRDVSAAEALAVGRGLLGGIEGHEVDPVLVPKQAVIGKQVLDGPVGTLAEGPGG